MSIWQGIILVNLICYLQKIFGATLSNSFSSIDSKLIQKLPLPFLTLVMAQQLFEIDKSFLIDVRLIGIAVAYLFYIKTNSLLIGISAACLITACIRYFI
tara:strand:- start:38 stop:337 length:300 start_codon:yes stop_codon:yes gene_type:complete